VVAATLTAGSGAITVTNGAGSITLDANINIALSMPSIFSVAGSPILNSGTFTVTSVSQLGNTFYAAPVGAPGTPLFRFMVPSDLPPLLNGQLYIGSAGTPTVSSLSAGSGIVITPGPGTITISATGTGTVTSVGLDLPVSVFAISGSPVVTTGTLTGSFVTQTANTVFAGPTSGGGETVFYFESTRKARAFECLSLLAKPQTYRRRRYVCSSTLGVLFVFSLFTPRYRSS
jgi:hypothetical protein